LPIAFFGNFNLGISGISCCNGFKSIVSSAEGVLGNVCSCHPLACGTRSKTSRVIFFRFAGGGVSGKRSSAYSSHLKNTRTNPCSACFDSFAWPVVLRICLLKKQEYSFGTVRSPSCHQSLILFAVSLHNLVIIKFRDKNFESLLKFYLQPPTFSIFERRRPFVSRVRFN